MTGMQRIQSMEKGTKKERTKERTKENHRKIGKEREEKEHTPGLNGLINR